MRMMKMMMMILTMITMMLLILITMMTGGPQVRPRAGHDPVPSVHPGPAGHHEVTATPISGPLLLVRRVAGVGTDNVEVRGKKFINYVKIKTI